MRIEDMLLLRLIKQELIIDTNNKRLLSFKMNTNTIKQQAKNGMLDLLKKRLSNFESLGKNYLSEGEIHKFGSKTENVIMFYSFFNIYQIEKEKITKFFTFV